MENITTPQTPEENVTVIGLLRNVVGKAVGNLATFVASQQYEIENYREAEARRLPR